MIPEIHNLGYFGQVVCEYMVYYIILLVGVINILVFHSVMDSHINNLYVKTILLFSH